MMERILIAVDFSPGTGAMIDAAAALGRALEAECWLVHVAAPEPAFVGYEVGPQSVRDQVATELIGEHHELHAVAARLRTGGLHVTAIQVQGPTVEKILDEAARLEVDLIVLGSHGHGALRRALLGSVSEGVLRAARCPVLIMPPPRDAAKHD